MVEEGRKGYRSDAGARGNPGRLCDPAVNGECPLLVGDHWRKNHRRRIELEKLFRRIRGTVLLLVALERERTQVPEFKIGEYDCPRV